MRQINIDEVKNELFRLVNAAAEGEAFVISQAGKALVKVVPVEGHEIVDPAVPAKRIGFLEGEFDVPDDFDRLCEDEIARLFGMSP